MSGLRIVFSSIGYSAGIYLAGTVNDHITCDISSIVIHTAVAKIACVFIGPELDSSFVIGSAGLWAYRKSMAWNRARPPPRSLCRRWFILSAATVVCGVLLCTHIATTVEIESSNGQTIKLTDAFTNFKRSKAYAEMWSFLQQLWDQLRVNGFWDTYKQFKSEFDLDGTDAAYDTLGIPRDQPITASELKRIRNALALEHHPDKQTNGWCCLHDIHQRRW